MKPWVIFSLFLLLATTFGKTKDNGRPLCSIVYTVVQEDILGNFQEGLANTKNLKWADNSLRRKYPDVCYTPTDQEAAKLEPRFEVVDPLTDAAPVKVSLFISIAPATYHGTKVVTLSQDAPSSGTVTDMSGEQIGTYAGTTRTTSSTAVPYSLEYGKFMLIVETIRGDGKAVPRHIFEQDGLYKTLYGVPLGGRGHHPVKALIEDAVKWLHAGGLDDALQSVSGITH